MIIIINRHKVKGEIIIIIIIIIITIITSLNNKNSNKKLIKIPLTIQNYFQKVIYKNHNILQIHISDSA